MWNLLEPIDILRIAEIELLTRNQLNIKDDSRNKRNYLLTLKAVIKNVSLKFTQCCSNCKNYLMKKIGIFQN